MARSRNIKPAFFTNDELAECEPLARLLFIGLWTISDFKGCLEWRPKKIKAQLLPYDDCDITKLMINLDKSRFIISYSDGNKVYIKIRKFAQHQHPHPNEIKKGSPIPECTEEMTQAVDSNTLIINHDKSRLISDDSVSNPSVSLIPITDSLIPDTDIKEVFTFYDFYSRYPIKKSKEPAAKAWNKLSISDKESAFNGIDGYINSVDDKKYLVHPSTYLNQKRWQDEKEGLNNSNIMGDWT